MPEHTTMIVYCLCKKAAMHGVRSDPKTLKIAYHLHLCSWHLLPLLTAARGCHGYELFIRCVAAAFLFLRLLSTASKALLVC